MNAPETPPPAGPAPTLRTHYLALLTPLILTHALQSAGGLLDGFWLGHLLGVRGMATAASFFPVFFLLLSLITGLGAGATILAGQAWGARDARRCGAWGRPPSWRHWAPGLRSRWSVRGLRRG